MIYDVASQGNRIPIFQRNVQASSSRVSKSFQGELQQLFSFITNYLFHSQEIPRKESCHNVSLGSLDFCVTTYEIYVTYPSMRFHISLPPTSALVRAGVIISMSLIDVPIFFRKILPCFMLHRPRYLLASHTIFWKTRSAPSYLQSFEAEEVTGKGCCSQYIHSCLVSISGGHVLHFKPEERSCSVDKSYVANVACKLNNLLSLKRP
jgi:hypothetical protein